MHQSGHNVWKGISELIYSLGFTIHNVLEDLYWIHCGHMRLGSVQQQEEASAPTSGMMTVSLGSLSGICSPRPSPCWMMLQAARFPLCLQILIPPCCVHMQQTLMETHSDSLVRNIHEQPTWGPFFRVLAVLLSLHAEQQTLVLLPGCNSSPLVTACLPVTPPHSFKLVPGDTARVSLHPNTQRVQSSSLMKCCWLSYWGPSSHKGLLLIRGKARCPQNDK